MINQFFFGALLFFFFVPAGNEISFVKSQSSLTKDTLMNVGEHQLHFVVSKGGEPTVLLEAGGGADATQWEGIQQQLARETNATIISYDRAGFGKSGLPTAPYHVEKEIQDLHKCLKSLGAKKIILVSHSYGAFLNQAYQFIYPENVIAIILADPNNVTFVDSLGVKILMRISFDTTKPLSILQKADVRQTIAFDKTIEAMKRMPFSTDIPITVISAGNGWWPFPKWNSWWKNSHQSMVNLSPNRNLLIAEGSYHNIPKDRPDMIVEAIMKTLKTVNQLQ